MEQITLDQRLEQASKYLDKAEVLLIGSGAGLSAAAGYDYSNKKDFAKNYSGMLQYGFTSKLDMMANFSVPYEILWGYYLQHVKETRFSTGINNTYQD